MVGLLPVMTLLNYGMLAVPTHSMMSYFQCKHSLMMGCCNQRLCYSSGCVWHCCVSACPLVWSSGITDFAIGFADMQLDPWQSVLGNHNETKNQFFFGGIVQLVSRRQGMHRVQQECNMHLSDGLNMDHMCKARQSRRQRDL